MIKTKQNKGYLIICKEDKDKTKQRLTNILQR